MDAPLGCGHPLASRARAAAPVPWDGLGRACWRIECIRQRGGAADLDALADLVDCRWAPSGAVSDADGPFIELTGVAHLHGGEARFCRKLIRMLARRGVLARVAVADTAGAAWPIARFSAPAPAQLVTPGAQVDAIMALPVAASRLEPSALELSARLGIDAVGQLLHMPRKPLVRRFGRVTADRIDQATGRTPEPIKPVVPPTRVIVEQRFADPSEPTTGIAPPRSHVHRGRCWTPIGGHDPAPVDSKASRRDRRQ